MSATTVEAGVAESITKQEARSTAYLQSRLAAKDTITDADFEVPIIDLSPSFSSSLEDRQSVASQIRKACTTSGFFYVKNHGIPSPTLHSILKQAERFFDLPSSKKEDLHIKKSRYGFGWEPSEYTSIAGDVESKEGFNLGYEAGLDRSGGDGKYRNLDGTHDKANFWPKEEDLPGFYEGVAEYYGAVLELARHLFRLFALSLDLSENHFDSMITHPGGISRLLYYPPPKNPQPTKSDSLPDGEEVGLGAHSDYECFTLLLSSTTPGLEILKPSGKWHIADHVPDAFIVNVADFLMRWTNDLYKSTIHRVVNRSNEARYSVPFFFSINYEEVVETLPTCLKEGEEPKYRPIGAGEYVLERLNATTKDGAGFYGNAEVFDKGQVV
ncbi:flavonol synthase/flavanone 3-hydroxylase [Bimuria novae-zelandiae CBS 107.79]|uniref:Flavonol synthase/flavanone 3-hydroxylase n=1 Tax=Bimuria novae-zelandiae CBS 107.79 TaxID=1447943 RepID=A0A6A5V311_9PLEO|nr:flavonol synthase/flavanone 3-hydroxylase [Bimuria novae-zelandiae CBS 107.79]